MSSGHGGAPQSALRAARKLAVGASGAIVLSFGVLLLVLPGPAFLVIPAGLAILGLEFAWARRWLAHVGAYRDRAARTLRSVQEARNPR